MASSKSSIINLVKEYIIRLKENNISVEKVLLFGSIMRGTSREDSDIDIVVELIKPDLFYLIGIKQAVEDALGSKVDVVRLRDKMNESLRYRIERDAIYV